MKSFHVAGVWHTTSHRSLRQSRSRCCLSGSLFASCDNTMGERRREAVGTKGKTCNVKCKIDVLNNAVEIRYPCTMGRVLSTHLHKRAKEIPRSVSPVQHANPLNGLSLKTKFICVQKNPGIPVNYGGVKRKRRSGFCVKSHLLFSVEGAEKMKSLFVVGLKVSSGKRQGQVWGFPVTIHFRKGSLQKVQILHFSRVGIT